MLTEAWKPFRPHRLQSMLWRTPARFAAVAAGRGSGKTDLARRYVVRMLPIEKAWGDPIYFFALPTYKQAKRVAWNKIKPLVPASWIHRIYESDMMIETVFGSKLFVLGLDNPARIEGDQWDGGVIDEMCDQKPKVFPLNVGPALTHRNGWCRFIGVPKRVGPGAGWFKDFFFSGAEPGTDGAELQSFTWPSSDILTPEELHFFRENNDPKDFREQYEASWEDVSGAIFFAFSDVLNVDDQLTLRPDLPLIIGSDFNVDPMAWVVCQQQAPKQLTVIDELFIRNTNTRQTLDELAKRYGKHAAGFHFFGDATSRSRNTRASESDYIQIRNDKRFAGARVFYPKSNPKRSDRFASCNALFLNANGERRCKVHPRCKNLIRDLTTRAYKTGTVEPDDYGDVGHITDALGYAIGGVCPLRNAAPDTTPGVSISVA